MQINDEVSSAIETVREYEGDIVRTKQKIKVLDEQVLESKEGTPEFARVLELEEQLKEARAQLKSRLLGDGHHNDLLEEKADLQEQLKDQRHILSEHLVAYFHLSGGERQIELGTNGDAREVILTGKLGKEQKYQTSLLAGAGDRNEA